MDNNYFTLNEAEPADIEQKDSLDEFLSQDSYSKEDVKSMLVKVNSYYDNAFNNIQSQYENYFLGQGFPPEQARAFATRAAVKQTNTNPAAAQEQPQVQQGNDDPRIAYLLQQQEEMAQQAAIKELQTKVDALVAVYPLNTQDVQQFLNDCVELGIDLTRMPKEMLPNILESIYPRQTAAYRQKMQGQRPAGVPAMSPRGSGVYIPSEQKAIDSAGTNLFSHIKGKI